VLLVSGYVWRSERKRGKLYFEIQFRTELLPRKLTTISLLVGSTATSPWMSVRTPLKVLKVFAPAAVTVGQAPSPHATVWPAEFSELQYAVAEYWAKSFMRERSESVMLAVRIG
jgi:hypothetical protein